MEMTTTLENQTVTDWMRIDWTTIRTTMDQTTNEIRTLTDPATIKVQITKDPATTEVWMTTYLAKIEARMTRDLATMAVFSSEEDCSCSCTGFYRRGMGGFEEAQGSRWSGKEPGHHGR
jgi:hypothetical protein